MVKRWLGGLLLVGKYTPPPAASGFLAAPRSYAPPPKKT